MPKRVVLPCFEHPVKASPRAGQSRSLRSPAGKERQYAKIPRGRWLENARPALLREVARSRALAVKISWRAGNLDAARTRKAGTPVGKQPIPDAIKHGFSRLSHRLPEALSSAAADQEKEKENRDRHPEEPQDNPTQLSSLSSALAEILHARESLARAPPRLSKSQNPNHFRSGSTFPRSSRK